MVLQVNLKNGYVTFKWLDGLTEKIMEFKKFIQESEESYHGYHRPPGKNNGSPFYNVCSGVYPDDFYTLPILTAARYYGSNHPDDIISIDICRQAHNKPEKKVNIYRAAPKILNNQEKIENYKSQKAQILKRGFIPQKADETLLKNAKREIEKGTYLKISSAYYAQISDEIEKLEKLQPELQVKLTINSGDWVTTSRKYAVEHGKSTLQGNYIILTKTVKAKDLYTDGNSLMELGYDQR